MRDYPTDEAKAPMNLTTAGQVNSLISTKAMNPTLSENIDGKIQYHRDEIERLTAIKGKFPPDFLGMNLRDLREAMQF